MIIEIGITSQDLLNIVENQKMRNYDLLANELSLIYKCKVKIIPYVMTWVGIVSAYHKKYTEIIGIPYTTEAYIKTRVLKKTLESVSFERRRSSEANGSVENFKERDAGRVVNSVPGNAICQCKIKQ